MGRGSGRGGMDDDDKSCAYMCFGVVFIISIGLFGGSFDTLDVHEYGILRNTISSSIDKTQVYTNGRYFVGLGKKFIKYPANVIDVEYSSKFGGPVNGFTEDKQAVKLDVGVQFRLKNTKNGEIVALYNEFQMGYKSYFDKEIISKLKNVAVKYKTIEYFTNRKQISLAMKTSLQDVFSKKYAELVSFQLMAVDLQDNYEETLVSKIVKKQLEKTVIFERNSTLIRKSSDTIKATAQQSVTVALANAAATGVGFQATAEATGTVAVNKAQADGLDALASDLALAPDEMEKYLYYRNIRSLKAESKIAVGMNDRMVDATLGA